MRVAAVVCAFLSLVLLTGFARAEELAVVRTQAGDVFTGRLEATPAGFAITDLGGVRTELASADVTSVEMVPVALPPSAVPSETPSATAGPVASPVAPPAGSVVRATIPSPPPPRLPGTVRPAATAVPLVREPVVARPVLSREVQQTVERAVAADGGACGAPAYESPWHFRGGLALGLGQGNSDFFDLKVDGEVERDPTPWGFKVAFTYVYGTKEDEVNANNWRAVGRVERKISGRAYLFGQVLYERDPLADLVYRWTFTVGAGYTVVDNTQDTLKLEAGLGATLEKRDQQEETFDPSGWLGADWEHRFDECKKLNVTYSFRPNFTDFDLSASTLDIRYSTPCFEIFDLVVGLRLEHVIDPPDDIEPLDLLFTVGLKFDV